MKMNAHKTAFLAFLLLGLTATAVSQDVILKRDNTTILSKVLEVTSTEIKYKKWSNQDGPTYSLSRNEVISISYQSGDIDRFTDNPTTITTAPTPQPTVTYPQVQIPVDRSMPEPKPQEPESPYTRHRVQFSLNGGIAFPLGNFGITDDKDFCAPFSLYGDDLETGFGAAKTGFAATMRLHIPVYKKDKDIVGIPLKFNLLYNGITDEEKKDFRTYYWDAMSSSLNEYYGVNAYSYRITGYPNYMNFSIMPGIDYTHYFNKTFALYAEANMGLNIAHISSLIVSNALGGTFVCYDPNDYTNYYSEEKSVFNYKNRVNFAYEFGGGIFVLNHISIGAYYTGYTPFSVSSTRTYSGKISDNLTEDCSGPKLSISALSIQLGVHF